MFTSTFPRWENDTLPPFVYEFSKRLTDEFDVYVLAPHFPGAKIYEVMEGVKVYRFRYFFETYEKLTGPGGIMPTLAKNKFYYFLVPFFLTAEFLALRKLVKEIRPNIIHAHWFIPQGFFACLIKKIYGIPYVATSHGSSLMALRWLDALKKFTLKNTNKITVVSHALKKVILDKIDPNLKIQVIPMGVDKELFKPDKKKLLIRERYGIKGPFLLYVGRFIEKKGVKYLIEAMPKVIEKFPQTKLLLVGNGPLEDELKSSVQKLDLGESVAFVGAVPNAELSDYYSAADIFIGPSIQTADGDTEGLGLTFVEAGLSGCALIGSKIGGIPDVIKNGKNGFLVDQKNSEDIAVKIIRLLNDSCLLNKIKNQAREGMINKFSWEFIVERYKRLLR